MESLLVERGVYWARYTKDGKPICYAVDSSGNVVLPRLVVQDPTEENCQRAVDALWNRLDTYDPTPESRRAQMRLLTVFELPSTQRRATVEEFDPYNLPPLPYRRRI